MFIVFGLALMVVIVTVWMTINLFWFKPFNINHFYERIFIKLAFKEPELLTNLGILEPYHIDFYNRDLTDASDSFRHELAELACKNLAILQDYSRTRQSPRQLLSTDILAWFLDDVVRNQKFIYHEYLINHLEGVQNELPTFMVAMHQIKRRRDAENYIARLSKFRIKFAQILDALKSREEKQIIPPRFIIQKVSTQARTFISQEIKSNILYTSFNKKLEKLENISDKDKLALCCAVEKVIADTIYPTYQEFITYLGNLENKATIDAGVWRLPDGNLYYTHILRSYTTTDLTPLQIHNLGLQETKRIQTEMRTVLDSIGYLGKSVAEHMKDLSQEERFLYPESDLGRNRVLSDYQAIINNIKQNISNLFNILPKMAIEVKRMPEFKERESSAAYYNPPSIDGSRPGIFYVNLRGILPVYWMQTLAFHETIPGHHLQKTIQQEIKRVPIFRKVIPFTAYVEGWALYSEQLAEEYGFYKDPYSKLGYLQSQLLRAVRLVVDTGIHYKKWTRDEAIIYLQRMTGESDDFIANEVDRYVVQPGQACAYMIGKIKILELRRQAMAELKSAFDIKKFHDIILKEGAMPLQTLEQVVQKYVKSEKTVEYQNDMGLIN